MPPFILCLDLAAGGFHAHLPPFSEQKVQDWTAKKILRQSKQQIKQAEAEAQWRMRQAQSR